MRAIGLVMLVISIIWGVVAFQMTTTVNAKVPTRFEFDSHGGYYDDYKNVNIHNLPMSERRQNHLIIAGVLGIVGTLLFGFGSIKPLSPHANARKCPFCAELVKTDAKFCKHCGKQIPEEARSPAIPVANAEPQSLTNTELLTDAAWNGNVENLRKLLKTGANPNQPDIEGNTALELARLNGQEEIVEILLAHVNAD